jgi:hypothetical protein
MEERVGDGGHIVSNRMTKWNDVNVCVMLGRREREGAEKKKCIGVKSDLASFMAQEARWNGNVPLVVSALCLRPLVGRSTRLYDLRV